MRSDVDGCAIQLQWFETKLVIFTYFFFILQAREKNNLEMRSGYNEQNQQQMFDTISYLCNIWCDSLLVKMDALKVWRWILDNEGQALWKYGNDWVILWGHFTEY